MKNINYQVEKNVKRVNFINRKITVEIILSGKSYVDWLPYNNVEDRAEIFFKEGLPFAIVDSSDKDILTQITTIRNAIAHKSPHSQNKFKTQVINNTRGLPPENATPAGYLRYVFRTTPNQTKFENYMIGLATIAGKIASYN